MIFETLNFLRNQIENFLGNAGGEPVTILSNPWSNSDTNKNSAFFNAVSLINIEEEKVFKTSVPTFRVVKEGTFSREPELKLNLYVLFSSFNKNYEESLKYISRVISFFQTRTVFDHTQDSIIQDIKLKLDPSIEKLVLEIYSPSFDQLNQIWASFSIGYLPSVMFKVRMLIIQDAKEETVPTISNLKTTTHNG